MKNGVLKQLVGSTHPKKSCQQYHLFSGLLIWWDMYHCLHIQYLIPGEDGEKPRSQWAEPLWFWQAGSHATLASAEGGEGVKLLLQDGTARDHPDLSLKHQVIQKAISLTEKWQPPFFSTQGEGPSSVLSEGCHEDPSVPPNFTPPNPQALKWWAPSF